MKITQLTEATYSNEGRTFVDMYVLYDPTDRKSPFVYFNGARPGYSSIPRKSGIFKTSTQAAVKLQKFKRQANEAIQSMQHEIKTGLVHNPPDYFNARDRKLTKMAIQDRKDWIGSVIEDREALNRIIVASYVIRGT
ncbi:MAG TPA: hypothetical protein VMV58_04300 [Desulfosporosinus sp.]|nr:hypothetical protein [Desulfosporosinus sp.]